MIKKAPVNRVLLCLAVMTLVGVTALALGSKQGFITINGGRQTVALRGPSKFFTPPPVVEPGLTTIYSNLGTGTGVYNCCTGWTISATGSVIGAQNWVANGFTPSANVTATQVQAGVGYVTGTNGVTLALAADSSGVPGTILHTWRVDKTTLPTFGTCCMLVHGNDKAGIKLTANTQYWVIVRTSTSTPDTWDAWNLDSNGASGPFSNNTGSGWQNLGSAQQGAFAVRGH
jgi:hypothetical protein